MLWGAVQTPSGAVPDAEPDRRAPLLRQRLTLASCAAGTVAAGAFAVARFGLTWQLPAVLVLLGWMGLIAAIDVATRRVPNLLTYPALLLSPVYVALRPGAEPLDHLLGGALGGGFFALAFLLYPRGIGLGDVKLALVLGLYLGWNGTVVALVIALLLGGVVAAVTLAVGLGRQAGIPYAPMLAAGGAFALLTG